MSDDFRDMTTPDGRPYAPHQATPDAAHARPRQNAYPQGEPYGGYPYQPHDVAQTPNGAPPARSYAPAQGQDIYAQRAPYREAPMQPPRGRYAEPPIQQQPMQQPRMPYTEMPVAQPPRAPYPSMPAQPPIARQPVPQQRPALRYPAASARPDATPAQNAGDGMPAFLADSMPRYGADMQDGGVPLERKRGDAPRAPEADAPAKPARPAAPQQMVNRRKTVERDGVDPTPLTPPAAPTATPAPTIEGAPPMRRGRAARHLAPEDSAAPTARRARHESAPASPDFDPFDAGDSETLAPAYQPEERPQRRVAVQGERYTGPRTARPQADLPAQRPLPRPASVQQKAIDARERVQDVNDLEAEPWRENMDTGEIRRPYPQARDPRRQPGEQEAPQPYDEEPRRKPAPRKATVERQPYEFEERGEEPEKRRRGCLLPIVIVLLVVGVALAGICLPRWDDIDLNVGGVAVGSYMQQAQTAVKGVITDVKGMILPEKERITSFSVTPAEGAAPVELVFKAQTSTSVTSVRVVDQYGAVVLEKTMTDADTLNQEIVRNSSFTLWTLRYTAQSGYSGLYTLQTLLSDGTWDEGMPLTQPVNIAAPAVAVPAAQGFSCDMDKAEVPAEIGFTAITGTNVTGVRVVDDYGAAVVTRYRSDGNDEFNSLTVNVDNIQWNMVAYVEDAYTGQYTLQYMTEDDVSFTASEYRVAIELTAGAPEPTAVPATPAPTDAPLPTVTATPTPTPTPEPTEAPTPTPTPEATPLPALAASANASADPGEISLKTSVYLNSDKKSSSTYERTMAVNLLDPAHYAVWPQYGVLTFRGDGMRQNAAFGTADVEEEKLEELWKVPVGGMKVRDGAVYGVGWPGQPLIVQWPIEIRNLMNLNAEKKQTNALKEVIVSAQDGKIYFLDAADGEATRDPIDLGISSGGGLAIATNGTPMLGVGQNYSYLSGGKRVNSGYHLFDLISGKELLLVNGNDKAKVSNYTGVSGAALFDKQSGTMILGGQNGVLYTVELGPRESTFDHIAGTIKVSSVTQRYTSMAASQKKAQTNIEGSVAMYNNYAYYADLMGVLQCVDVNAMTPVWAVKTGAPVEATPALDFYDQSLSVYTGNMLASRKAVITIRRYDALTGEEKWAYEVPEATYNSKFEVGCKASPVVGQKALSELVYFTVANGDKGSDIYALNKADGSMEWTLHLEANSYSSPVAVYDEDGNGWLLQAEGDGKLHLIDALKGKIIDTLALEGEVVGSPAVRLSTLVIGTTGKDTSFIYGVKIK